MSETSIAIKMEFPEEVIAKEALARINNAVDQSDNDFNQIMFNIAPFDECYQQFNIWIDSIQRKKSTVHVNGYAGSIEFPKWLVASTQALGAYKAVISQYYDEGGQVTYYLHGKHVSKKEYILNGKPDVFTDDDIEINKQLYLPEGRVSVKATLLEYSWHENDYGEYCIMSFVTTEGDEFIYQGKSAELVAVTQGQYENYCEFDAAFERVRIDGTYYAAAKRPTKVKVFHLNGLLRPCPCGSGKRYENCHGLQE